MGAKEFLTGTVFIAGLAIAVFYISPDLLKNYPKIEPYYKQAVDIVRHFSKKVFSTERAENLETVVESGKEAGKSASKAGDGLFTPEELSRYDGTADSPGLYLALMGKVFDVSKGAQHYRPGGGYSFFAGRDATRAYVTGDFTEEGLIDSVDGLSDDDLMGLNDWLSFYESEYTNVGKVIGRYYDKEGKPTQELLNIQEKIDHALSNKWKLSAENKIFPPCNSEWSREKGSRVWCSNKSGGIERDWVGVPRRLFKPGQDAKCVCVRTTGPPSDNLRLTELNRGDLDNPKLKEYPQCPPTSVSCAVDSE